MIPISLQAEPRDFQSKVRQKGLNWFAIKGLDAQNPLPPKTKLPDYWTDCIPDLRSAYDNICAYVCIHIEEVTGSATVEHFKPKSLYPSLAYEWSNYLLVCGVMNGRKSDFEDVLNPFSLEPETFFLNLTDGKIRVNPQSKHQAEAISTIERLQLNAPECKKLRLKYWNLFRAKKIAQDVLQDYSPFVYLEAQRQGLL